MKKPETIILKKRKKWYLPESSVELISSIAWMFEEGPFFVNWIKNNLIKKEQGRLPGNASVVILAEGSAFIEPLYGDDAEDYRVEMTRDALLKLINDWEALVEQQPDEIVMTRDEQGKITLEGIFNHQEDKS